MVKKYHPNWAIFGLVIIGIIALAICIIGGIWLAHGIGVAFKEWGACPSYFSDFLGGALGLTVGFALDKFCIERINHVFEYRRLMKIIKNELINIKAVVYKNNATSLHTLNKENQDKQYGISVLMESNASKNKPTEVAFFTLDKLKKFYSGEEKNDALFKDYTCVNIREFIFDNIVKTAETVSVLSNIPLACGYDVILINKFMFIQKYIEEFNDTLNSKSDKSETVWLLLQFYINLVLEVL